MTVIGATCIALFALWAARRSVWYEAAVHYFAMGRLESEDIPRYVNRLLAQTITPRGRRIQQALSWQMKLAPDKVRRDLAEFILASAPLFDMIKKDRIDLSLRGRHRAAEILDQRIAALTRLGDNDNDYLASLCAQVSRQDGLFAGILHASDPSHLKALRENMAELETGVLSEPRGGPTLLNANVLAAFREIFDGLEQYEKLNNNADRSFLLSEALTRTVGLQSRLIQQSAAQPALGLLIAAVALESMQQVFNKALKDLRENAELDLRLCSRELTTRREAVITAEIVNTGQSPAHNVEIRLLSDGRKFFVFKGRKTISTIRGGQSRRIEFRVEPHQSERVRLVFCVSWDRLTDEDTKTGLGEKHERRFSEEVAMRRVQASSGFRALHPNPYVLGRALGPEDPFYGRDDLLTRIRTSFQGADQDNLVVLLGARRMGKTSVLRRVHQHLPESYVPALVDLQGFEGFGEAAFFYDVASQLCEELKDQNIDVLTPAASSFANAPGQYFRRRFLRDVRQALGERRLLLFLDEVEILEDRIKAGDLSQQVLPYLRSLMQHEDGVSFMLIGTHRLDELTADYWGVLFNLAVYLEVGHLQEDEVRALLTEPTKDYFEIDSLALDKVYRMTGGHPYLSQVLGHELVKHCNRSRISYATVGDMNDVVDRVVAGGGHPFGCLWDDASGEERLLLLATRSLLKHEGVASVASAHRYLSEQGVEHNDLPEAARRLVRRQILTDDAGKLSFRIDLLRLWIKSQPELVTMSFQQAAQNRGNHE